MEIFITRKSFSVSFSSSIFFFFVILQTCFASDNSTCNENDYDSLLSFYQQISYPFASPLNWSSNNCCNWEGIDCDDNDRVESLWLPSRGLSGIVSSSLGNLSFLSYLNLSHNKFSGSLPDGLFRGLNRIKVLDLSYNSLSGIVFDPIQSSVDDSLPVSVETVDLSSNHFNGSIDLSMFQRALNLMVFNVSNNSFAGTVPSLICKNASFIEVLDFSMNEFSGQLSHGFGGCSNLELFRAGSNKLSGRVPYDLFGREKMKEISLASNQLSGTIDYINMEQLSNLTILELHSNHLTGELPKDIGSLSNLETLVLHTNNFTGSLPPSLMKCTKLKVLLLRNNMLEGEVSSFDFSKLQQLQSIDLGYNNFSGEFPASLCLCRSLSAVRLAYNKIEGQLPSCMSQMKSLDHLSLSNNFLKNATGALRILMGCKNLTVIFMSRSFQNETLPDDKGMGDINGFQHLEILTLGGGKFTGEIPNWISKLKKLKVLNICQNKVSGPVPTWLGDMPNLLVINITDNHLSGQLPRELGNLTALRAEKASDDFSYLKLPFLFSTLEYGRLFNLPRGLKFGTNNLSGNIPAEIGRLKQLQMLDLRNNDLSGSIPEELSNLINLEKFDLSGNHLTGQIPQSLRNLHFLSFFSVANNDLEGEVPQGDQFDTFTPTSFEGNPKLCGFIVRRKCASDVTPPEVIEEDESDDTPWYDHPVWMGFLVGFVTVCIILAFHSSWRHAYFDFLSGLKDKCSGADKSTSQPRQTVYQLSLY